MMKEHILKIYMMPFFEVAQMLNLKEWAIFLEFLVCGSNKRQIKNCIMQIKASFLICLKEKNVH